MRGPVDAAGVGSEAGAGLGASPADSEGCCSACAAGGAGPGRTCKDLHVPPRGPGPVAMSPPPLPLGCVSRCHPRTAVALRNLGSAEKGEIAAGSGRQAAGRERESRPASSGPGHGGPPGSPPSGDDVMGPHRSRPLAGRESGGRKPLPPPRGPLGKAPRPRHLADLRQVSSRVGRGAGAAWKRLPSHQHPPSQQHPLSQQASPGLCSWAAPPGVTRRRSPGVLPCSSWSSSPWVGRKRRGCARTSRMLLLNGQPWAGPLWGGGGVCVGTVMRFTCSCPPG